MSRVPVGLKRDGGFLLKAGWERGLRFWIWLHLWSAGNLELKAAIAAEGQSGEAGHRKRNWTWGDEVKGCKPNNQRVVPAISWILSDWGGYSLWPPLNCQGSSLLRFFGPSLQTGGYMMNMFCFGLHNTYPQSDLKDVCINGQDFAQR